jgi:hypothetical protein
MVMSPRLHQPTPGSQVWGAATAGGSWAGGAPLRQPENHRPDDAGSTRVIAGGRPVRFAMWRRAFRST